MLEAVDREQDALAGEEFRRLGALRDGSGDLLGISPLVVTLHVAPVFATGQIALVESLQALLAVILGDAERAECIFAHGVEHLVMGEVLLKHVAHEVGLVLVGVVIRRAEAATPGIHVA